MIFCVWKKIFPNNIVLLALNRNYLEVLVKLFHNETTTLRRSPVKRKKKNFTFIYYPPLSQGTLYFQILLAKVIFHSFDPVWNLESNISVLNVYAGKLPRLEFSEISLWLYFKVICVTLAFYLRKFKTLQGRKSISNQKYLQICIINQF